MLNLFRMTIFQHCGGYWCLFKEQGYFQSKRFQRELKSGCSADVREEQKSWEAKKTVRLLMYYG